MGPRIHDARIAALCLQHGVTELWSADRDFGRFPDLKVRNPRVRTELATFSAPSTPQDLRSIEAGRVLKPGAMPRGVEKVMPPELKTTELTLSRIVAARPEEVFDGSTARGHELVSQHIGAATEIKRHYNRIRAPYFQDLLAQARKSSMNPQPAREIVRRPGNPFLRYVGGAALLGGFEKDCLYSPFRVFAV